MLIFYILTALLMIAADFFSKLWAMRYLQPIETIPVIKDFFHFTYVENRGIAFGLFSGGRIFFIVITIIILAVVFFVIRKTPKNSRTFWQKAGCSLIVSGALGNMIDRAFRGFVVDFIDFRFINFPVFNIADIAVCVGACMLLIHYLFMSEDEKSGK